jgi:hypothetical protein
MRKEMPFSFQMKITECRIFFKCQNISQTNIFTNQGSVVNCYSMPVLLSVMATGNPFVV